MKVIPAFESFVNSERCKTVKVFTDKGIGLRALLIQKDAKLFLDKRNNFFSLRALLIQKDAKPLTPSNVSFRCLRALLIQKDAKLINFDVMLRTV